MRVTINLTSDTHNSYPYSQSIELRDGGLDRRGSTPRQAVALKISGYDREVTVGIDDLKRAIAALDRSA